MKKFIKTVMGFILCLSLCFCFAACSLSPATPVNYEEASAMLTECFEKLTTKEKIDINIDMGILGSTHTITTPEKSYMYSNTFGINEVWFIVEEETQYTITTIISDGETTKTYTKEPSEGLEGSPMEEVGELPPAENYVSGETKDGVTTLVFSDSQGGTTSTITFTIKNDLLVEIKQTTQEGVTAIKMTIKYDNDVTIPSLPETDDQGNEIVWTPAGE